MCGYPSSCEVNANKGHKNSRNKWFGRIDIYIDAKTNWYFGEAKKTELTCSPTKDWGNAFQASIDDASHDARQVAGSGEGKSYIALSFWALVANQRVVANGGDEGIRVSLSEYLDSRPFDAAAWYFLDRPMEWGSGNFGLGVVLGIQSVGL